MVNAAVSFYVADSDSGKTVFEYNALKSLVPASVMKLVTTSAALELLGPDHKFRTTVGYTGTLKTKSGRLNGNIIIKGGGDPVLGSVRFEKYYSEFTDRWVAEIKKSGIKKIRGRVITDDSYYNYQPVPSKWLFEDVGNYYGAGAYGLSVFDNTYEINLRVKSDSTNPEITGFVPEECRFEFSNQLVSSGTHNEGTVYAIPYSTSGWISGNIPGDSGNYTLRASITDPPLIMAKIIDQKLKAAGITISNAPSTKRLYQSAIDEDITPLAELWSPPLKDIIEVMNHESVNLYAEHLLKELGKVYRDTGATEQGIEVVKEFLEKNDISTDGLFMEDGSGLSPLDAINSKEVVNLLWFMKYKGKYFNEFYSSLPHAGKEGTLKEYFKDPLFGSGMSAKSGSMTRVRSYAGYLTTSSGKELIFCIIVNNYSGPPQRVISGIGEILKEILLFK